MISRAFLSLLLVLSTSSFADSKPVTPNLLDRCMAETNPNPRESFLFKVDCVHKIFSEQVGGDDTLIASAMMSGKFIEANQNIRTALKELPLQEWIDAAKAHCGPVQGKLLENACVNQFPALVDRLILLKAALEVLTPSVLPINRPTTFGKLREAHLDLLRKKSNLQ